MIKFSFPIIGLGEHKIKSNSFINKYPYQVILFCYDETKSVYGGTGFFIKNKPSYVKQNDLNISSDNNLESTFYLWVDL